MSSPAFNKLCEIEDFRDPEFVRHIRTLLPEYDANPAYPAGFEHRKCWEFAQLMRAFEQFGVLHPASMVLGVASGVERPIFELTKRVRFVFATDIYGHGDFASHEAAGQFPVNPDAFAVVPYNRNRLVVQYMNALDIRHEADTFDGVFSLSSIEHFGGFEGGLKGVREMARVCKPGGIVMVATECIVNAAPRHHMPDLYLFSPDEIIRLADSIPELELIDRPGFAISKATLASQQNLETVVTNVRVHNRVDFPHLVLEIGGCCFTSVSLVFRKR
jgi:SAM-dependent methyltransferase